MRPVILTFLCAALVGCDDLKAPKVDAPPDPTAVPSRTVVQTSGGGTASSANYRVRLSIGTPQPMGTASSDNFKAHAGAR